MDGKHLGVRKDFKLDVRMCALQIFPEFLCCTQILMVGIYEQWLKVVLVLQVGWKKLLKEVLRCTSDCVGVSKTNFPLFPDPKLETCFGDISVFLTFFSGCQGLQWDDHTISFFLYEHILGTSENSLIPSKASIFSRNQA